MQQLILQYASGQDEKEASPKNITTFLVKISL